MIIVTGGAGFIGSNIVLALNELGYDNVLVVDNLENGIKFKNLVDCRVFDYIDKRSFINQLEKGAFQGQPIQAVFHQGACSSTTEWDGRYLMENNYEYSKRLFSYCQAHNIQFIYASSAAVYGNGTTFKTELQYEKPLNVYGYSKFLFDQYLRANIAKINSQAVGLRYFNVYGPREHHKGTMASVAFHLNNQLLETGKVKLFAGSEGYENGEQLRDFIYVDDVVKINLWLLDNPNISGIFNVGTGRCQSFNEVAQAVIEFHGFGEIEYIPFPDHLKGCYQNYTQANIDALREVNCLHKFSPVEEGVNKYMAWLNKDSISKVSGAASQA